MQKLSTRLSLAAILVACYSQANAIDLTCSNSLGCNYSKTNEGYNVYQPSFSKDPIDDSQILDKGAFPDGQEKFNITVQAGNYTNTPATDNAVRDDGIITANTLFGFINTSSANQITFKTGVVATLDNYPNDGSSILALHRYSKGSKAIIEPDVTFIMGSSFDEINQNPDGFEGSHAIYLDSSDLSIKESKIILNGRGAEGISANDSTILADNLSIRLNSEYAEALVLNANTTVNANHLVVTGDKDYQVAIDFSKYSPKNVQNISLQDSQISLGGKGIVFMNSGVNDSTTNNVLPTQITVKNSKVSAGSFFLGMTDGVASDAVTLSIEGGEINTQKLISINDPEIIKVGDYDEDELESELALKINATQGAKLQGVSYINPNYQHGTVGLTLNGNSQWKFKGDSTLDNLSVNNSTVEFEPDSAFHTLTINQDLSGSGEFILNSDLASEKADQIIVKGSVTGDHRLQVRNSRNEPKKENGKVILVKTNSGDGTFSLKDKPYVDAGIYRYELEKDNNNWVLAHKGKSADTEEPQPQPQ
ncbi:pertactin-like passenger domain-containing protein, partial [Avibacterium avium]|uniref:pertactin-like passenger domain-containing protein n=2 Tax=Avibacterium TaxID=292486 RepID=UPI003BF7C07A